VTEPKHEYALVTALYKLAKDDDRAALASLRRALSGDSPASAYPIVARYFFEPPNAWTDRAMLLVASLFALHPRPGRMSLGQALREVHRKTGSESVEARFVALLNAHPDDLGEHLRHAVSLCRSQEVELDWHDLLRTVLYWGRDDDGAGRRRQARAFWRHAPDTDTADEETP
jgi:CRISPR system Cascade subunit CasB